MSHENANYWDAYVHTPHFRHVWQTLVHRRRASETGVEDEAFDMDADGEEDWTHGMSALKAKYYFYGLRGSSRLGPRLVYTTSLELETFDPPAYEGAEIRRIELLGVYEQDCPLLRKDDLWSTVLIQIAALLDEDKIPFTSIDLVRFRWEVTPGDRNTLKTSAVTIWIGVLPDSTASSAAYDSAQQILAMLRTYGIEDLDVCYRESTYRFSAAAAKPRGMPLLGPSLRNDVVSPFLDRFTTALSLPISSARSSKLGSIGFYFKDGEKLYGVTTRHVLFDEAEGNWEYRLKKPFKKRKVLLMDQDTVERVLIEAMEKLVSQTEVQAHLNERLAILRSRVESSDDAAAVQVPEDEQALHTISIGIQRLEDFVQSLTRDWMHPSQRRIGRVVWAPPIKGSGGEHQFMQDVCVIELDKAKIGPNFRGNGIDLGTEIDAGEFKSLMSPASSNPPSFKYPFDRIFHMDSQLPVEDIAKSNSVDSEGQGARFVIKNGAASGTTVGRLSGFKSLTRLYQGAGIFEACQMMVCARSGPGQVDKPFSTEGDSGAAVVGGGHELIGMITGAAGLAGYSDITYCTPVEWLWEDVIKREYPNATLFWPPSTS